MGILVVRLKAIKYKKDSFCYLSSYPLDLGLQAACLLTLSFQPYAFRTFVFLAERICSSKPFRILDPFYNLNSYLLNSLLTLKMSTFLAASRLTKHRGAILIASNKLCVFLPAWLFQRPKVLYRLKTLFYNYASYWPRLGLAIGWPSHWLANCKALRGDLDPNGIRLSKVTSQHIGYWWVGIKTAVR